MILSMELLPQSFSLLQNKFMHYKQCLFVQQNTGTEFICLFSEILFAVCVRSREINKQLVSMQQVISEHPKAGNK